VGGHAAIAQTRTFNYNGSAYLQSATNLEDGSSQTRSITAKLRKMKWPNSTVDGVIATVTILVAVALIALIVLFTSPTSTTITNQRAIVSWLEPGPNSPGAILRSYQPSPS
jgi:hypothetical protein